MDQIIAGTLFQWLLVFVRIGVAFINLPSIGEFFVPTQVRLALALIISAITVPVVADVLPSQPDNVPALALLILSEALYGAFLGNFARLLMSALEVAGMVIAMQSALGNASIFNPALSAQSSLPGALLGWMGLMMIFVTNLHHMLILSVVESYAVFRPGSAPPWGDFAEFVTLLVASGFRVGVQMAAPFIAVGLMVNLAMGLIARLAPQIQVFFVFMSLQVAVGLFLLSLTLGSMVLFWLRYFEGTVVQMLRPV